MIYLDQKTEHTAAWCLHCEKAIDASKIKFVGNEGVGLACPHEDCDGGAFDLHWWSNQDWPKGMNSDYPDVPEFGKLYPLYGN